MKIGVFDSGIGGLSVVNAIKKALPDAEVVFLHDSADHFPYATKSPEEIYGYVEPLIANLVAQHCDAIVVACNTVSTTLIGKLREKFTIPFVALEPMIKPAASLTKSGVIAVCATPTTLASDRYTWLKKQFAQGVTVLEPDCSDWSYLIENNAMNETKIRQTIKPVLLAGADVIVLGCTHYHWIEEEIRTIVDKEISILQPETPVVAQLKRVLGLQS
jgi:glutamate racemase